MSQGLRYKFNGSTFAVQSSLTGGSPLQSLTNITQGNPAVVSAAAHPYTLADVVKLTEILGPTNLNGNLYVVDNPVAGVSFELAGENTLLATAYISGGKVNEVVFTEFCELTGANQQDGGADQIEVTTICSTAKEFEQGLSDSGTLQLDYNVAPGSVVQAAMTAAKISGDQIAFKITFPDSGGTIVMLGTVQQQSIQGQVNGVWTGSATIKLSGPIFSL